MNVYYRDKVGLRCIQADTDNHVLAIEAVKEEFIVQSAILAVINGGKQPIAPDLLVA